jgi:hypothetical protein
MTENQRGPDVFRGRYQGALEDMSDQFGMDPETRELFVQKMIDGHAVAVNFDAQGKAKKELAERIRDKFRRSR